MGGRTMPLECPHGAIIDWGDFGDDIDPEECAECERSADQDRYELRQRVQRVIYDTLHGEGPRTISAVADAVLHNLGLLGSASRDEDDA